MDRLVRLGRLLDYYGGLLTKRQRELLRQYAYEDCSLAEIAEREGISRQGVRDAIVHSEQQLSLYDDALGLIEKNEQLKDQLVALSRTLMAQRLDEAVQTELIDRIAAISAIWEDDNGV